MTSILFLIETSYCNIFRCNYLRNKKLFLNSFLHFRNIDSILNIFKKKMTCIADVFWTYGLRKTCLDNFLKSPVSEDPSTSNMVNGRKHCWCLNISTFTIFLDNCEGNSVAKSLSWWYEKYWDCLLIHWMPMTSILFLIQTIYYKMFWCNYLRKRKFCGIFFCIFEIWIQF